jgi:hypothetical protein
MTVVFATPAAAFAGLVGLVPVAVAIVRSKQARGLRRMLGLPEPTARARLARPLALSCAFALLGLAAAQPSVVQQRERLVRTDAELLVVLDNSRSMLASTGASAPRYRRAAAFARKLRVALLELPTGVASLNNRLLPYLFPTVDDQAYASVVAHAYGIQKPPPALDPNPLATAFDQLNEVTTQTFFSPPARKRVLVVLSDAETRPFDARGTLAALRRAHTTPIVVRFWHPGERIPHESYHSTQPRALERLRAAGWPAYAEGELRPVVRRITKTIAAGPLASVGYRRRETSIAPEIALAALAPLLLLIVPAGLLRRLRRARRSSQAALH